MKIHYFSKEHLSTKYIMLNNSNCQACWKCVSVCPKDVIEKLNIIIHKHAHIDNSKQCLGCFKCVKVCPSEAIIPLTNYKKINYGNQCKKETI